MRVSMLAVLVSGCVALGAFVACVGDDSTTAPVETPPIDGGTTSDGPANVDGSGGNVDGASDSSSGQCTSTQVDCNGACVETSTFQTNATSCGACGHDCLGGTCAGGKCQPLQLVAGTADASTKEPVVRMLVDGSLVYYTAARDFFVTSTDPSGLYSCPITGGAAPSLIQSGNLFSLAVTSTGHKYLVVSDPQNDELYRYDPAGSGGDRTTYCAPGGGEKLCVFVGGVGAANAMAIDGTNVFWGIGTAGHAGDNHVIKTPLPNGQTTPAFGAAPTSAPETIAVALDPDDAAKQFFYTVDLGGSRVLAYATSGLPATLASVLATSTTATGVSSIAVKGGKVFFTSSTGVYSTPVCPATGCPATAVVPTHIFPIANASAIVADASSIYFAAGTTVSSCPLVGCVTPKTLFEGTAGNVTALAQDATAIYMGDDRGNVGRIAK
jgi:hypothetical protein